MNLEDYIKDLSPELQERARACGSVEELLALAKEAKVPVPDDVIAAVAGGDGEEVNCGQRITCPKCGSNHVDVVATPLELECMCKDCGYMFVVL